MAPASRTPKRSKRPASEDDLNMDFPKDAVKVEAEKQKAKNLLAITDRKLLGDELMFVAKYHGNEDIQAQYDSVGPGGNVKKVFNIWTRPQMCLH